MPELDYALLADYVRVEEGLAHVIGGGVDTVQTAAVPKGQNLALVARFRYTMAEAGRSFRLGLILTGPDDSQILEIRGRADLLWPQDVPRDWPVGFAWAVNFGVPLPAYGRYRFDLLLDEEVVKTLPLRVTPLSQ